MLLEVGCAFKRDGTMAVVGWSKIALLALLVLAVTTSVVTVGKSDQADRVYRIGLFSTWVFVPGRSTTLVLRL